MGSATVHSVGSYPESAKSSEMFPTEGLLASMKRILLTSALSLLTLLALAPTAVCSEELTVSNPRALPFTLEGVPAFLSETRYEPKYFCVFTGVPISLPPDSSSDRSFHMAYGMLGIHTDSETGGYTIKQLKLFSKQDAQGAFTTRPTERTFSFLEKPLQDDPQALHLASDEKAADEASERTTEVYLDRTKGTGYIRNAIWSSGDRTLNPSFDFRYPFRFVPVRTE